MNYKAVFFDFDYTLGDATDAIVAGYNHAFAVMGCPPASRQAIRETVGCMLADGYTIITGDRDERESVSSFAPSLRRWPAPCSGWEPPCATGRNRCCAPSTKKGCGWGW
ncbi:MAG: HAD hydrolase-like protein [Oscillospiraceae bacterium]